VVEDVGIERVDAKWVKRESKCGVERLEIPEMSLWIEFIVELSYVVPGLS
jgi:hypothetical protein